MSSRGQREATVGVALPVPEPWGSRLQNLRVEYGEHRAVYIPTHVTLLPPTRIDVDTVAEFRRHLKSVAENVRPFRVMLRGTGTFRPVSQVVFVQLAEGVAPCEQLEKAVRSGPVQRDLEFPYHPHVTVAHNLPAATLDRAFTELADFHCSFPAERFRMYLHHGDEMWHAVDEFDLCGPGGDDHRR